jgi:hypothetical protein
VRRADTFPGLGSGWIRIAVRDRATSDAFVKALELALHPTGAGGSHRPTGAHRQAAPATIDLRDPAVQQYSDHWQERQ